MKKKALITQMIFLVLSFILVCVFIYQLRQGDANPFFRAVLGLP